MIYYISKNNIDNLYRSKFGSVITEKETGENKSKSFTASLKFGLDKLIALISGTSLEVKGDTSFSKTTTEKQKRIETSEDRALFLVKELFTEENIEKVNKNSDFNSLDTKNIYAFELNFSVTEKFKKKGLGTDIILMHKSDTFEITGHTSKENWVSSSLVNNILSIQNINEPSFLCSGIFSPIQVIRDSGKVKIIVQFLIIFQSE